MHYLSSFSGFSTNDIAEAKKFYGETLGLAVKETPEGLELELKGDHVFIYPKPDHVPATFTVLNFIIEDIDVAVDDLAAKGISLEHYDSEYMKTDEKGICRNDGAHPGPKGIAWFKDPAGNFLSLIQEN
jgi:catechol 2,3-dioxygenase-like lactoylglutathione lyase family enzyme